MRIGSVTKSFTGLMAATFAEAGKIDVTAPIGRYAPRLHASLRDRSLRARLTHDAGLADESSGDGLHDTGALEERVLAWGSC